jgi:hypothetical protein
MHFSSFIDAVEHTSPVRVWNSVGSQAKGASGPMLDFVTPKTLLNPH